MTGIAPRATSRTSAAGAREGTSLVVRADAGRLPLADNSVDLVVTSPPYFALRSYTDGGEHYAGQIGAEETPAEFVKALLDVTRECARVVKPSGSIWVNLGDKYATRYSSQRGAGRAGLNDDDESRTRSGQNRTGVPEKSLLGLPWRYALGCIDELELVLRAEVIWSKPNGLPESVTDRVRRSHEQWFHFTVQPRYFSAVDEIREPHKTPAEVLARLTSIQSDPDGHNTRNREGEGRHKMGQEHPLGKLPGSVWTVPTQPLVVPEHLGVDHFAAFPTEWPKRIIQGWSPSGICTDCGEGRRPITEQTSEAYAAARAAIAADKRERTARDIALGRNQSSGGGPAGLISNQLVRPEVSITGYVCACPTAAAPTRPAVVLDPFGGTGTTAMVARALGRAGVSADLSADYCRLARWRTEDLAQHAKVRGEDFRKEQPQHPGQDSLFEDIA